MAARINDEVIEYKGFTIEFHFPHYYVYYNKKNVWTDIEPRGCRTWIDELLSWLHEDYSVVAPGPEPAPWPIDY